MTAKPSLTSQNFYRVWDLLRIPSTLKVEKFPEMQKKEGRETYRENQYRVHIYWPGNRTDATGNVYPVKYRKIELDQYEQYTKFLNYCDRKFPGWTAINVYGGLTRSFLRQINKKNR